MAVILQFKIELLDTSPVVWRRIQVPADYSFWDLHVAIQDAMGWTDIHLHAFMVEDPKLGILSIGIPDPDEEITVIPGWKRTLKRYFKYPGDHMIYEYDFGDSWRHSVLLEAIALADPSLQYPRCLDGARKCPPEDCGGPGGFADFLHAIADPHHEDHAALLRWCGGRYKPEQFNPKKVRFDDPDERFRLLWQ